MITRHHRIQSLQDTLKNQDQYIDSPILKFNHARRKEDSSEPLWKTLFWQNSDGYTIDNYKCFGKSKNISNAKNHGNLCSKIPNSPIWNKTKVDLR